MTWLACIVSYLAGFLTCLALTCWALDWLFFPKKKKG